MAEITTLNVGDILTVTWGYDQTNVDFYQITRRTEKSIWTRPIRAEKTYTQNMSGTTVPLKDEFTGDEKRSLIKTWNYAGRQRFSIKIDGRCAGGFDGTPQHFTCYA